LPTENDGQLSAEMATAAKQTVRTVIVRKKKKWILRGRGAELGVNFKTIFLVQLKQKTSFLRKYIDNNKTLYLYNFLVPAFIHRIMICFIL